MKPLRSIPRETVRQMSIIKQGLLHRPQSASRKNLLDIIYQIGLLQLDSISVTARSHYLVMLSRAGLYDPVDLDSLLDDRLLFEQWAHAACLIPMIHYPYFEPVIQQKRGQHNYFSPRLSDNSQILINAVLDEIRQRGPLSSKEFESSRGHKGSWWNWKPAKIALEWLFDQGYLMVRYRRNFHRYYDLTERVLDGIIHEKGKTLDDYHRWAVVRGLRHMGIATVSDIADYYRLPKQITQKFLSHLEAQDEIISLDVAGWRKSAYIHREDLPLLEDIEQGLYSSSVTTFLSPFDNLIWHRERTEALFDFFYRVEMYTPEAKRQYGYYVLPILYDGCLVGRIDPKIDRRKQAFIIRALYLEKGIVVDEKLIDALGACIREFMVFHRCEVFMLEQAPDSKLKQALVSVVNF